MFFIVQLWLIMVNDGFVMVTNGDFLFNSVG